MTEFTPAPEVADLVNQLIGEIDEHHDLALVRIECVWRDKAAKSKGRVTLATARKISGLPAFLSNWACGLPLIEMNDPFFVIEVAADTWEHLNDKQRKALVDHELMHCKVALDENDQLVVGMRGHDVEEFAAIVDRHGLWKPDLAQFGSRVADQLALAVEEAGTFLVGFGTPDDSADSGPAATDPEGDDEP